MGSGELSSPNPGEDEVMASMSNAIDAMSFEVIDPFIGVASAMHTAGQAQRNSDIFEYPAQHVHPEKHPDLREGL